MTPPPTLLTPDELLAILHNWSIESDKGSWGKEDVGKLLGHIEALYRAIEQLKGKG